MGLGKFVKIINNLAMHNPPLLKPGVWATEAAQWWKSICDENETEDDGSDGSQIGSGLIMQP